MLPGARGKAAQNRCDRSASLEVIESFVMGRQLLLGVIVQAAVYVQALVLFPVVIWHAGAQGYGEFVVLVALLYLLYGLYASGVPYRYRRGLVSAQSSDERRALFAPQFAFQLCSVAIVSLAIVA